MALAMRVRVERAVQLINRRAAKPAVEDGERPAHAFPPECFAFQQSVQHSEMESKSRALLR
jgi:hypothetical protein